MINHELEKWQRVVLAIEDVYKNWQNRWQIGHFVKAVIYCVYEGKGKLILPSTEDATIEFKENEAIEIVGSDNLKIYHHLAAHLGDIYEEVSVVTGK